MKEGEKSKFTFEVLKQADKSAIKKAVEDTFKVTVLSVTTRIAKGKSKRFGSRKNLVKQSAWKKATVQLAPGQKIALFEAGGVQ